jgi:histidinol-phosphate aminotransferase
MNLPLDSPELPLRGDLRGLSPYGAPQLDVAVRLNTNENPHPPSPGLVDALGKACATAATELNRYPDREASALRADLAAYLSAESGHVEPEQVWAANGSNEVLQQLCQAFGGPGRTAIGFEPSYSMHRLIARATATSWHAASREADFTLDPAAAAAVVREVRPSLVFLTSPNNPTGTALPFDVLLAVHAAAADVPGGAIVVVDEAYAEFRHSGVPSAVGLLPELPRLVVTRTMSKAFALAGGRIGYLAAAPEIVDALHLVRLPYHLSSLTQAAARVALAHREELLGTVAAVREQRDRLLGELPALGCAVTPSDANFVLFRTPGDQTLIWQALVDRGVLVRDVGLDGWLRVTAGLPQEIDTFLAALREVLQEVVG